jgi:hypothetical protein
VIDSIIAGLIDVSSFDKEELNNIFTLAKLYKNLPTNIPTLKTIAEDIRKNLEKELT